MLLKLLFLSFEVLFRFPFPDFVRGMFKTTGPYLTILPPVPLSMSQVTTVTWNGSPVSMASNAFRNRIMEAKVAECKKRSKDRTAAWLIVWNTKRFEVSLLYDNRTGIRKNDQ